MVAVLILGATGYVGGSLLVTLKKAYPDPNYTAVVRSSSAIPAVEATGASVAQVTSAEHDKISELSYKADIVINAADSDDIGLNEAILAGLKKKKAEGRGTGSLIHTSGIALFLDGNTEGKFNPSGKVWDDGNEDDIKSITPSMMHAPVDIPIMKAGEEGLVNTFIVCPAGVYGVGFGPGRKTSVLYKIFVGPILEKNQAHIIGEGSSESGFIHIKDLISLYMLVFKAALATDLIPLTSSAYSRYFIASSVLIDRKSVVSAIAEVLYKIGRINTPELKQITYEEAGPFAFALSANSITRSTRAKELGWSPKEAPFEEVVGNDIEVALKELPLLSTPSFIV